MQRISVLLFAAALAAPACSTGDGSGGGDDSTTCGNGVCDTGETEASCPADCTQAGDQWDQQLNSRVVDYNAALKIASLRLTGALPSMADINAVAQAPTDDAKKTAYANLINQYIATPAFTAQMMGYWRDTMKQGGSAILDTAPAFAAQLTLADGDYRQLFTAGSGNCPTWDGMTTFTSAECANGGPKAGVLTDPGVMQQFYSNFAFRRTRWVQETFACTAFPAQISATPTSAPGTNLPYTGMFPFDSIAGTDNGGRVNFHDTSAVVCANCHSNLNHIAPLFANYDMMGVYQTTISVTTPLTNTPLAVLTDYLPTGEGTAWRAGVPTPDLVSFGAALAKDPDVAACGVARVWNWALGKTDIVDTLQQVPVATIQTQVDAFVASGYKIKTLIAAVYTSDDFVKF